MLVANFLFAQDKIYTFERISTPFNPPKCDFSPDSRYFVYSDNFDFLEVDLSSGEISHKYSGPSSMAICARYSPDGSLLACGYKNGEILIFNTSDKTTEYRFNFHSKAILALTFSPDGRYLVSGSRDNSICITDITSGEVYNQITNVSGNIRDVVWGVNNKIIVATNNVLKGIRYFNIKNGSETQVLELGNLETLTANAENNILVSGSLDKTIYLWDLKTGQKRGELIGHKKYASFVALSKNGKILLSGSDDKTAKLWDIDNNECIATLEGHTDKIYSVAISPKMNFAATMGWDHKLYIWDISKLVPSGEEDYSTQNNTAKALKNIDNRYELSSTEGNTTTEAEKQNEDDIFQQASSYFGNGNYQEAIKLFNKLLKDNTSGAHNGVDGALYYLRGACFFFDEQYENAEKDFIEFLKYIFSKDDLTDKYINTIDVYLYLTRIYYQIKNNPDQAVKYSNMGISKIKSLLNREADFSSEQIEVLKVGLGLLHHEKANMLNSEGKYNEALMHCDSSINAYPNISLFYTKGIIYDKMNNYDNAILNFQKYIILLGISNSGETIYDIIGNLINIKNICLKNSKGEDAIEFMDKAISIGEKYVDDKEQVAIIYDNRGALLFELSKNERVDQVKAGKWAIQASNDFSKAIEYAPSNGLYYYHRGITNDYLFGYCNKAKIDWEKACKLGYSEACNASCSREK